MPLALDRHKYVVTDEFTRLLDAARSRRHKHSQRDYTLLAIAGLTGLRPVELTGVTLGDLHLDETPAWLAVRTAKQRGGARDTVMLPPTAVQALRTYAETLPTTEPDSRVFHMTTRQAGRLFRFYARLATLDPAYSIKALRHFRGLRLYQETLDPQLVRDQLRHRALSSTQVYIHTLNRERAALVDL